MSNVVSFPTPKVKLDEMIDIQGRADLRQSLAEIAGMLTRPCSYEDIKLIDAKLSAVQLEVACWRVMASL